MGMLLTKPDVYDEPVKTVYSSLRWGSVCLALFSMLCVLVIPFVAGILMGGFWIKHGVFVDTPEILFEDKAALRVLTSSGSEYLWGSSETIQALLAGDARSVKPFVSLQIDDVDRDGRADFLRWAIEVPLAPGELVTSFEFLPALKYSLWENDLKVQDQVHLSMETAPYVSLTPPAASSGNSVEIDGDLEFHQTTPLFSSSYVRYDRVYQTSHFSDIHDLADLRHLNRVAAKYARRNQSAVFNQLVVSWNADVQPWQSSSFVCSLRMRVKPAMVDHVPSAAEAVKWGWVQYFCLGYVVYWVLYHVRRIIVKNGLVDTIVVFENLSRR